MAIDVGGCWMGGTTGSDHIRSYDRKGMRGMPTISPFVGKIQCRECGSEEHGGKLMDIDEYGDRTLLWCTSCEAWVKWHDD